MHLGWQRKVEHGVARNDRSGMANNPRRKIVGKVGGTNSGQPEITCREIARIEGVTGSRRVGRDHMG